MKILIASEDSAIGGALAILWRQNHDVVCTSRKLPKEDPNYLDVTNRDWQPSGQVFDRVVFAIAHDAPKTALDVFDVNVIGSYEWLDKVAATSAKPGTQMAVLTSQFGSIAELSNQQAAWYRMSKAALNMGVSLLNMKYPHLSWVCLHPGLVDTPMTKDLKYSHAKISPGQSASYIDAILSSNPTFGFYDAVSKRRIKW